MFRVADIVALADRALELYRTSKATSIPSAAQQAVQKSGITYPPDVRRIGREVCAELGRRSAAKKRKRDQDAKNAAAVEARYEEAAGRPPPTSPQEREKRPAHYEPVQLILEL